MRGRPRSSAGCAGATIGGGGFGRGAEPPSEVDVVFMNVNTLEEMTEARERLAALEEQAGHMKEGTRAR